MSNLREEFERLPEIARLIREGDASYHEGNGWYLCENIDCSAIELALDTAWYAFQEQQKKIDAVKSKLSNIYDACDENTTVALLLDEIQELLK